MFTVTLHHLAPDAKKAGSEFPDLELPDLKGEKLRGLIASLAKVAKQNHGSASPELRIAAPSGKFVVRALSGGLRFTSWTTRVGGADLTPDQIFDFIAGTGDAVAEAGTSDSSARARWMKVVLLAVLIAGSNAVTAWMLMRPPPNPFVPDYQLLPAEPAGRLLADVAGDYQTGTAEGDRRLRILRDGRVNWAKFGLQKSIAEEENFTVQSAHSGGKPALFTSTGALIEIVDGSTLKLYGDTYRRTMP